MAIIEVEHLRKRYGDTVAVNDVSLAVDEGEIFGILGPNGAGKTTSVECLCGLREPDEGRISVLTTGLDPQARRDVWGLIEEVRGHGVTIVRVEGLDGTLQIESEPGAGTTIAASIPAIAIRSAA